MIALVEREQRPTLEDFLPVAKAMGITDVRPFWEAFDKLQQDWAESRLQRLGG